MFISFIFSLVGRIVFQLFSDVCPKTSKNFLCLCTGMYTQFTAFAICNAGSIQRVFLSTANEMAKDDMLDRHKRLVSVAFSFVLHTLSNFGTISTTHIHFGSMGVK